MWIKAIIIRYFDTLKGNESSLTINWEEIENQQLEEKSEKIIITVSESEAKLFVISVFTTTGRTQVQGSGYRDWASFEFPLLLRIVDIENS